MLVVTGEQVAGHRVKRTLGQCFGVVVRSRGLGGNIMAGLHSIVGGEIHEYTQLLEEGRRHAVDRLVENAALMGANGVMLLLAPLIECYRYKRIVDTIPGPEWQPTGGARDRCARRGLQQSDDRQRIYVRLGAD